MKRNFLVVVIIMLVFLIGAAAFGFFLWIPQQTTALFGSPDPSLSQFQADRYAVMIYLDRDNLMTSPGSTVQEGQEFRIEMGDTAAQVSDRLENAGFISDGSAFLTYLVYKGYDRILQSGAYSFSSDLTPIDIASAMIDPTPLDVTFVILPGMRFTEIAELIDTSGLSFSAQDLLHIFETGAGISLPAIFEDAPNLEGLILAGEYEILRSATAVEFVQILVDQTAAQFTPDVLQAFSEQGLNAYQAITLASIVEREAVQAQEKSLIASVFLNRLEAGMLLQSDPTVQYAIASMQSASDWWKVPLSAADLQVDSLYNTYIYNGLPPTPICAVSVDSLIAIAIPLQSDYYYFRSACDGSGFHVFARDYSEHQSNACP